MSGVDPRTLANGDLEKALAELPHISPALSRAEVSYSKVRAMTRVAKEASAAQLETLCRGIEQVTDQAPPRRPARSRCARAKMAWCASKHACIRTRRPS